MVDTRGVQTFVELLFFACNWRPRSLILRLNDSMEWAGDLIIGGGGFNDHFRFCSVQQRNLNTRCKIRGRFFSGGQEGGPSQQICDNHCAWIHLTEAPFLPVRTLQAKMVHERVKKPREGGEGSRQEGFVERLLLLICWLRPLGRLC